MTRNRAVSALWAQNIHAILKSAQECAKRKGSPRLPSILDQRANWETCELRAALEKAQLDQEIDLQDLCPNLVHELCRGLCCSSGRQQIVDQQYASGWL